MFKFWGALARMFWWSCRLGMEYHCCYNSPAEYFQLCWTVWAINDFFLCLINAFNILKWYDGDFVVYASTRL